MKSCISSSSSGFKVVCEDGLESLVTSSAYKAGSCLHGHAYMSNFDTALESAPEIKVIALKHSWQIGSYTLAFVA